MTMRLDALPVGRAARVSSVDAAGSMHRRLLDLGFTDGALTRCVYVNPSGNPRAYAVRGTVIALRNADARAVGLREEDEA